jgi:DNA-directed RNA polymerase specialized sigma24 family protein
MGAWMEERSMNPDDSVTRLIEQLRSVDAATRNIAARRIWDHYFPSLLELARNRLDRRVRQREDEEDILQDMYQSFCRRQNRGDFDLKGRDELWGLLVQMTLRKAINTAVRHRAGKRDVFRETTPLDNDSEVPGWVLEQIEAFGPNPADAAALNELLEIGLQGLLDPELRQIALEKLEGRTNREIAARLDYTEVTIERKMKLIRARWTREL